MSFFYFLLLYSLSCPPISNTYVCYFFVMNGSYHIKGDKKETKTGSFTKLMLQICELRVFCQPCELDRSDRTVTLFSNDDLGDTL